MPTKIDLSGQTFGQLTAIKIAKQRDRRGRVLWQCRCKCGKKKNVATGDLKSLQVKSCGCVFDLTKKVFGKLTVIKKTKQRKNNLVLWLCKCECGKKILVRTNSLTTLNTKSCGCYKRKRASETHTIHGEAGKNKSHLYRVWFNMKKRCKEHKDYAGRGIKVCKAWTTFTVFRDWALTHGYREDLQIDRIDNDGDYTPDNCRWVTRKVNARNTRRNRWETIDGITKCLAEWCEIYNVSYQLVYKRLASGWNLLDALTKERKSK